MQRRYPLCSAIVLLTLVNGCAIQRIPESVDNRESTNSRVDGDCDANDQADSSDATWNPSAKGFRCCKDRDQR